MSFINDIKCYLVRAGFFNSSKSVAVSLIAEDVPSIAKGNVVKVTMLSQENRLEIKMPYAKKGTPSVFLNYSQITAIERMSDIQIQKYEKSKSVIGRGIVGGLLLGYLGATIGAISGTGSKQIIEREIHHYVIINYTSSSGEIKAISFKEAPSSIGVSKFVTYLKVVANIEDIPLPDVPDEIIL